MCYRQVSRGDLILATPEEFGKADRLGGPPTPLSTPASPVPPEGGQAFGRMEGQKSVANKSHFWRNPGIPLNDSPQLRQTAPSIEFYVKQLNKSSI